MSPLPVQAAFASLIRQHGIKALDMMDFWRPHGMSSRRRGGSLSDPSGMETPPSSSTLLKMNHWQMDVMYALSGCPDADFQSKVRRA